MAKETINLVHAFQDDEYSRQLPRKKDYVTIQKGIHKQMQLVLCNHHELFVAFKERKPDVKIGFSKFCTLCHKLCHCSFIRNTLSMSLNYLSKYHFVSRHSNWEVTYKDLVNKVVCNPSNCECMMHCCTTCPGKDHYVNFWKRSSVTLILIFNFTTHNGKLQRQLTL